ncbi:MAG: MBL fold metallo-hydrolase [Chloroflexi bacterium]|nr:MBL fold metallo-hydrolase [Chloroflexota bacterium]
MKLTILGSSAAYPRAGGACSGYLVEEGKTRLLVDCGTGVLSNMQKLLALKDMAHIIISHLHADHCIDLVPYRYALMRPVHKDIHPQLYLPPGGAKGLLKNVSAFNTSLTFYSDFFKIKEYDPKTILKVGDLNVKFAMVKHYIDSHAMAITGSKKMVYSSDSGVCDELAELALDADLFLCEATRCDPADADWGHLAAVEVGKLAKKANVRRLMLTHFWPECDYTKSIKQAEAAFGKPVEVAEELRTYNL